MKYITVGLTVFVLLVGSSSAQVIRGGGNPYSSQLMTDPDAGTIQGIQRYGRPLPTDPEQGGGYPYFVFPSVRDPSQSSPFSGSPTLRLNPLEQQQLRQQLNQIKALQSSLGTRGAKQPAGGTGSGRADTPNRSNAPLGMPIEGDLNPRPSSTEEGSQDASASSLPALSNQVDQASNFAALTPLSAPVFVPGRTHEQNGASPTAYVQHQPLIQIKLRVVEVARDDALAVSSTLDYISNHPGYASLIGGRTIPNVNNSQQNLTGASRFDLQGLINVANDGTTLSNISGAGAMVNLTSEHLNWIASLLATEFEADVLTAPELVTINGQGVEFVAGSKEPFLLGTVKTGPGNTSTNHVFYKHVGTYLKVKPRIVNYGPYGSGNGDAPIIASDVCDWNKFILFLLNEGFVTAADTRSLFSSPPSDESEAKKKVLEELTPYTRADRLVPLATKTRVLDLANQFSRTDLRRYASQRAGKDPGVCFAFSEMISDCDGDDCNWKPEDCTIDLEVLARFSNQGTGSKPDGEFNFLNSQTDPANPENLQLSQESDVRAVANIIQIRNGTGLVMAGLLAESDVEVQAKVPILGDLPAVGVLFRAKTVSRAKSEILIFIEARILSQDDCIARAQSAEDLHLATPYVTAGTLDNPLDVGLYHAGFGTHLPPPSCHEQQYWERCSRNVNRIRTTAHDAFE